MGGRKKPDEKGNSDLFRQMSNLPDTSTTFQFPDLGRVSLDQAINPAEYILGPGDEIAVSIIGPYSQYFSLPISPDGKFVLPQLKVFQIEKNESLAHFQERMLAFLKKSFRDSDFDIFLSKLKSFRVSISGEIKHPGFYEVNGASKLSDIVKQAGFLETSSSRLIRISNGDSTATFDLLSALYIGDNKANPYLHQGDKIFLPANEPDFNKIEVLGAVNKPGAFEYRPGDTVDRALALSLGLLSNADSTKIKVIRFVADSGAYKEVNISLWEKADFPLQADDRIMAYEKSGYREKHTVEIDGEISYAGFYPIKSGVTKLSEVINAAGGFTDESSLFQAQLFRELKDERGQKFIDPELDRLNKMLAQDMTEIEREYWENTNT